MIYISLFTVAFMVATIVPFGSEAYFVTLLSMDKYNDLLLIIAASLGNVLGSVFNWVCGYYVNYFIKKPWFPLQFLLSLPQGVWLKTALLYSILIFCWPYQRCGT